MIINIYAPNVGAPKLFKHTIKDLKPHRDHNTVVLGDFHIPLSTIDGSYKQKIQQRNPRTK
jgi:hypothetical protein